MLFTVTNNYGCIADEINIEVPHHLMMLPLKTIFYPNPFRDVVYSNVNLNKPEGFG